MRAGKKRGALGWTVVLWLALCAPLLWAQTVPVPPDSEEIVVVDAWEIETFLRRALTRSAAMRRGRAIIQQHIRRLDADLRPSSPEFEIVAGGRIAAEGERLAVPRTSAVEPLWAYGLPKNAFLLKFQGTLPLFEWGRNKALEAGATARERAAEEDLAVREEAFVESALRTYLEGTYQAEIEASWTKRVARLESLRSLARTFAESGSGEVRQAELLQLESLITRLRSEMLAARLERQVAQLDVDDLVGPEQSVDLSRRRLPRPDVEELDEEMEDPGGLSNQTPPGEGPMHRRLARQLEAIDHEDRALRKEALPYLELAAEGSYWADLGNQTVEGAGPDFPGPEPNPLWAVELRVVFDLDRALAAKERRRALRWRREQLLAEREDATRRSQLLLGQSLQRRRGAAERIAQLYALNKVVRRRYDLAADDFAVGLARLPRVVAAEEESMATERRLLEALVEYVMAGFTLLRQSGSSG